VIFDEIDGYPIDVDGEGDPIEIGTRRTDQFPDYKIVKGSTPAAPKDISRIVKAYERSDQREFHVPCPFCGFMQPLIWRDPETKDYRLVYTVKENGVVDRASVAYLCAKCKARISERFKQQMLDAGSWIPRAPGREVVGFYINALYSPWRENWHELAQEWYEANKERNPEKLKAFINLRLGEPWEEDGDALEAHALRARCEKYPENADVPNGVGLLTASVDVQDNRLEAVVKGFGAKEESWLITYLQFFGDPGREDVWNELDEFLRTKFKHQSGRELRIAATLIDSGGHHTDDVYKFVKVRQSRHVFACRGASESGKEILSKYSMNNRLRVKLFTIGTDTAKDRIFARMKIPAPAPGFMHLPEWIEDEYLEQLTSEKAVRRYRKGRGAVREYVKTRDRNEALDLEVYALAALYSLGNAKLRSLEELAKELSAPIAEKSSDPAKEKTSTGVTWGNDGGFINAWRP
jgi:phage terminase large subunit GpA-like protein